jgi:hypothetical protein
VPDPFVTLAAGRAHFRPADLLALVALLRRLRGQDVDGGGRYTLPHL